MRDEMSESISEMVARLLNQRPQSEPLKPLPKPELLVTPWLGWMVEGLRWKWNLPSGEAGDPLPDLAFPHVVQLPAVILILGSRGSGKTALGFRLLELFEPHTSTKFVVGMPKAARLLLPKWIKFTDSLFTLPDNVTALVDEAHLNLGPHMSEADRRELASQLALSRQRDQTIIFISQQARTVSREIVSVADILLIKTLREHQVKFDRPEFEAALTEAGAKLETVTGDRKPYSFLYAPDDGLKHLMKSEKPGFWTEQLSKLYAGHTPRKSLTEEAEALRRRRVQLARQMRAQGFSIGAIAKRLGVSKGSAWNYVQAYGADVLEP